MPRDILEIPSSIETLSILDQDGNVDTALDPQLPDDFLLGLHRWMLLGRRFDERMLRLQRQGRIGTFAPVMGQEAANVGARQRCVHRTGWQVLQSRGRVDAGRAMEDLLLYYGGYNEGGFIPEGVNNLPTSIPVGSQGPCMPWAWPGR